MLIQKLHALEDKEMRDRKEKKQPSYLKWARLSRGELSDLLDLGIDLKALVLEK